MKKRNLKKSTDFRQDFRQFMMNGYMAGYVICFE